MTNFLEKTLSSERLSTYKQLAENDKYGRTVETLYALNLQYSKELYVILGGLEIAVRNNFNNACVLYHGKKDWLSIVLLKHKHQEQVNKAIEYVTNYKKENYNIADVVSQLNYGFWVNLCNSPYEKTLWNNALYKCFPYLGQKPNRNDIRQRLDRTLKLRNNIAHLEPIIKKEDLLIQEYRNASELLYAICPQTQEWFENISMFKEVWHNRFNIEGT